MRIYFILLIVMLGGCTIAPLTEHHTARTLGDGNHQWDFAAGTVLSTAYRHGINDKLDLGAILEFQAGSFGSLLGLDGKYLLIEDNPLSILFGAGYGDSTKYAYVGPIKSLFVNPKYELSFNVRYNYFEWDIDEDDSEGDYRDFLDDLINAIKDDLSDDYQYLSADISNTYWISDRYGITLSIGALKFLDISDSDIAAKAVMKFHINF